MKRFKHLVFSTALIAVVNPLYADIVWSNVQDINLSWAAPGDSFPIPGNLELDLNNDDVIDFKIGNFIDFHHPSWFYAECYESNRNTGDWIGEAGGVIDNSRSDWTGGEHLLVSWMILLNEQEMGGVGPWLGKTGYMGLQFDADGETHFGWVHMTAYDEFPGMTIHSWAYETVSGQGIVAGAIPEPSSGILTVIGALSVWFLRKKNRR